MPTVYRKPWKAISDVITTTLFEYTVLEMFFVMVKTYIQQYLMLKNSDKCLGTYEKK